MSYYPPDWDPDTYALCGWPECACGGHSYMVKPPLSSFACATIGLGLLAFVALR